MRYGAGKIVVFALALASDFGSMEYSFRLLSRIGKVSNPVTIVQVNVRTAHCIGLVEAA